MAGKLTTHVLDTETGRTCGGMRVELHRQTPDAITIMSTVLDETGRATLMSGNEMSRGTYEIVFYVGNYHRARETDLQEPPFLDQVPIRFGISDPLAHYHVPLVMSRYGYTTYRGS